MPLLTNIKRSNLLAASLSLMVGLLSVGFKSEAATPALQEQALSASGSPAAKDAHDIEKPAKPAIDRSGRQRFGKASFYANRFGGRKMADGQRMDLKGDNAASRTLPLGTTAKVTNLETGKSSVVTIQDRGPYVSGRIVDLSPSTAEKIGLTRKQGVVKVEVSPIAVPMPDGRVKLGAAASDPNVVMNLTAQNLPTSGGL